MLAIHGEMPRRCSLVREHAYFGGVNRQLLSERGRSVHRVLVQQGTTTRRTPEFFTFAMERSGASTHR